MLHWKFALTVVALYLIKKAVKNEAYYSFNASVPLYGTAAHSQALYSQIHELIHIKF